MKLGGTANLVKADRRGKRCVRGIAVWRWRIRQWPLGIHGVHDDYRVVLMEMMMMMMMMVDGGR